MRLKEKGIREAALRGFLLASTKGSSMLKAEIPLLYAGVERLRVGTYGVERFARFTANAV